MFHILLGTFQTISAACDQANPRAFGSGEGVPYCAAKAGRSARNHDHPRFLMMFQCVFLH
jgi:hypothetical protein